MFEEFSELKAFVAVARAGGFREAARAIDGSASGLSDAIRRLETRLGARLLHRTTRSITPTEDGRHLLEQIGPAFDVVSGALAELDSTRTHISGTLRLHVPANAARLILPPILSRFLPLHPEVRVEVKASSMVVDVLAEGCDAGIRYDEALDLDVIAVPIGPRVQRFAAAASPAFLDRCGRPQHPRDLLQMSCFSTRFGSGKLEPWTFERDGEEVRLDPTGPFIGSAGACADLAVELATAGLGVVNLFEGWLKPRFASGELEPVLEPWWQRFSGPFLFYPSKRLMPAPLRAFVDFIKGGGERLSGGADAAVR